MAMQKFLALLALFTFAAFICILLWFVRQPDLAFACILGLALASYDFWDQLVGKRH
ncbi:MAG: hypothetical protein AB7L41_12485 [Flavobacteriaceae bacterium]